ncbi:MAG: DUF4199 domain-containing protein [Bacteroidales bacterium]|nr:DUF4199 domain-containing protein [Bacteroidales bacterium]
MLKYTTNKQHTFSFSALLGLALIANSIFLVFFGDVQNKFASTIPMILQFAVIFYAVKTYKLNILNNEMNFSLAFVKGIIVGALGAVPYGIFQVVKYSMSSALLDGFIEFNLKMMEEVGYSQELMTFFKATIGPASIGFGFMFSTAIWGVLISLLVAQLLKTRKIPTMNNN